MKALILNTPGGAENLLLKEIEKPSLQENEVLVKTKALSINPVDAKTRSGKAFYEKLKGEKPLILGWDISGEVVETGKNVKRFKKGDNVFGMVYFPGHGKAYAEYVAASENHLALRPVNSTYQEAAATTLAALTAWQVLVHIAKIKSGQKVLIHAAAGGVGHFAVQIAKHLGAYVAGTASAPNISYLKEIGTDQAVDYTKENYEAVVKNMDIVFDCLGAQNAARSLKVMKDGGKLVSILGGANEEVQAQAKQRNIEAVNYLVQSNGEDMEQLAMLLKGGKLKPYIAHQFAFADMADAHRQIETGKTRGKIVINMD